MTILPRYTFLVLVFGCLLAVPAKADECIGKTALVQLVSAQAEELGRTKPEFRITEQADGQALLYWRHGMDARRFYAVTFRPNGCAVLTNSGKPRRFIFPRSAYNTGVFEEMSILGLSPSR